MTHYASAARSMLDVSKQAGGGGDHDKRTLTRRGDTDHEVGSSEFRELRSVPDTGCGS